MSSTIEVFISHSARDADAAEALIRLLRAALALPASAIRCTSVDGYRLPGGADTNSRLRQEVIEAIALLGIISTTSLRSLYVLFELGARWGTAKPFVPLLAPGTPEAILGGPLAGINALRLDRENQVQQLLSDLAGHLGRPLEQAAVYQAELTAFSAKMAALQRSSIEANLQATESPGASAETARGIDVKPGALTIPVGLATHYRRLKCHPLPERRSASGRERASSPRGLDRDSRSAVGPSALSRFSTAFLALAGRRAINQPNRRSSRRSLIEEPITRA